MQFVLIVAQEHRWPRGLAEFSKLINKDDSACPATMASILNLETAEVSWTGAGKQYMAWLWLWHAIYVAVAAWEEKLTPWTGSPDADGYPEPIDVSR